MLIMCNYYYYYYKLYSRHKSGPHTIQLYHYILRASTNIKCSVESSDLSLFILLDVKARLVRAFYNIEFTKIYLLAVTHLCVCEKNYMALNGTKQVA